MHVTLWKTYTKCGVNFVQICIEVMAVRVRHGKIRITDLRDLVLTPEQIRLRLNLRIKY